MIFFGFILNLKPSEFWHIDQFLNYIMLLLFFSFISLIFVYLQYCSTFNDQINVSLASMPKIESCVGGWVWYLNVWNMFEKMSALFGIYHIYIIIEWAWHEHKAALRIHSNHKITSAILFSLRVWLLTSIGVIYIYIYIDICFALRFFFLVCYKYYL